MPVSVIVTAGGTAEEFANLLAGLRPTLRLRDEVVCVLPPDRPDLASKARAQSWLTVLDESSPLQADRWSAGLAATTHPVAVLLDGDTIVTPRWLDAVAAAFDDPTVIAAGPRCQRSFGPQRVELPDEAMAGVTAFKAYARQWRQDHRGLTDVDRLGPVCVAVRRDALQHAGGPTLDMPYDKLREQGRLVLVENTLIAHLGDRQCALRSPPPTDAPLLSASMIVKDEEAVLADCLDALRDLVDEIVVYDTGSTDRTTHIAREHGARVIDGYWDDHFGDARNRSLAHCHSQWALIIDADEIATGDAAALRQRLSNADQRLDALAVTVENQTDAGTEVFLSPRVVRAAGHRYSGRLHEQVVDVATGEIPVSAPAAELTLRHSGYTTTTVAIKDKTERNRRLAALAATESTSGAIVLYNLARSELAAGNVQAAMDACRAGLAGNPDAILRTGLLNIQIRAYAETDHLPEANAALAELRTTAQRQVTIDQAEIIVRTADGDHERVLELLRGMPDTAPNDLGAEGGRGQMTSYEINSLIATGQPADAADILRTALRTGRLVLPLGEIATVLEATGSDVTELARLIPPDAVRQVLYATRLVTPTLAEAIVDALWERFPGDPQLFGVVVWLTNQLPLTRAIQWSGRLREQGLAKYCPLLATATATDRPATERALAAAAALELYGDQTALAPLTEALAQIPDEQTNAVLEQLHALAPGVAAAIEPA